MKQFFGLFVAQCVSYGLLCWNFRAVAVADIQQAVFSDLIIAALNYKILKKIMAADSTLGWVGYTLGGAVGSAISIYLTQRIWGR